VCLNEFTIKKRELKDGQIYNKYQKRFAELPKDIFFGAGLMLYLGEGDKRRSERISLANPNPKIVKFFIKWMIEFLEIKKEEIRTPPRGYGYRKREKVLGE